jgi:hypothetical protein
MVGSFSGFTPMPCIFNARDAYLIDPDTMPVVRRIFAAIAAGQTLYSVIQTLDREGVSSPRGARWSNYAIRHLIFDPIYEPHTHAEVAALVAPQVAATLDPDKAYGLWRFAGIPVPVPDSGIPRQTILAARAGVRDNKYASNAGHRFWPLSGGVLRCALCGRAMEPLTSRPRGKREYRFYRCPKAYKGHRCPNNHLFRAEDTEALVWAFVEDLMSNPDRLRTEFDRLI